MARKYQDDVIIPIYPETNMKVDELSERRDYSVLELNNLQVIRLQDQDIVDSSNLYLGVPNRLMNYLFSEIGDKKNQNKLDLTDLMQKMLELIKKRKEEDKIIPKLDMWLNKYNDIFSKTSNEKAEILSDKEREMMKALIAFNMTAVFLDEGTKKELKFLGLKSGILSFL